MRALLVSLLLLSCSEPSSTIRSASRSDLGATLRVASDALSEWRATVGPLRPLELAIVDCGGAEPAGRCVGYEGYRLLEVCADRLPAESYDAALRAVLLHELVHAHLTCSDADHSDDEGDLMYPRLTARNLSARIPARVVGLLR